MLGQTIRAAENLWFVQGEMPQHVSKAPDWCNVVIYLAGDRLYLIDSSGGAAMRTSIDKILNDVGAVDSFTLINTHSHLDHVCNNDLIDSVRANTKRHYILRAGTERAALDAPAYFARQFEQMDQYFDPFSSYQTDRMTYRIAGWIRDGLGLFVGRPAVLRWLFTVLFKKFEPVRDSRSTMEPLEDLPSQLLTFGGVRWDGWPLGSDDVFVLAAPSHSSSDVLVYVPEHQLLCVGDLTFPLYPTWADSNAQRITDYLRRILEMAKSGDVTLLADGHGDRCYAGAEHVSQLVETVLSDHSAYVGILKEIFRDADGLTPCELYEAFQTFTDRPVVARYLALEFPHTPASLQNVMVTTLLQLGYQARGERRRQRFYRAAEVESLSRQ
jgi:glyoxylase-like metal-dependent hydrolase (beta-lactamase superfamily II)